MPGIMNYIVLKSPKHVRVVGGEGSVKHTHMTLRTKLNLIIILNALLGLLLVTGGFSYVFIRGQFQDKGDEALRIAEMVSMMPQIVQAFDSKHPSVVIQPLAEQIRTKFGAQFIVVGNMKLIRYSHPTVSEIGKRMDENDNDSQVVLHGKPSISQAMGTLGLSVRGKAPIFDSHGRQIGIVSVGFLVDNIWSQIVLSLAKIIGFSCGGLILSMIGAHVLSGHVKRQIFGMEPSEIAHMAQEQSAILQSIQEGILAVDDIEIITACNEQAKRLLDLESVQIIGQSLRENIAYPRLCEVISEGPNYIDLPMVVGNTLVVVNRVPVQLNGEVIGAVITFRDKLQLDQMDKRLEDIERYAGDLRSQRHEFMNRLHTISGLIHLKEYDQVCELIDQINSEQHHLLTFFAGRIRLSAILGLIVGKMHRARELGIRLEVHPESMLSENCPHLEVVVTVLGNALDNAIEAMSHGMDSEDADRDSFITVYIKEEPDSLVLTVKDSGPGIDPVLGEKVFEDGVTTKGVGRGLGLSLCSQMVSSVDGQLSILSSREGALLKMVLQRKVESRVN